MSDEHPLTTATFLQLRAGSFESAHGNGDGLSYYGPGDAKLDRSAAELIARLTADLTAANERCDCLGTEIEALRADLVKAMAVVKAARKAEEHASMTEELDARHVDDLRAAIINISTWLYNALAALDAGKETTDEV